MIDREKVIKGLEVCRDQDNPPGYRFTGCEDDCPYYGNGCAKKLKEEALALLKEQPELVRCADCRHGEIDTEHFVRPVIVCKNPLNGVANASHRFEWFCADGERRTDDA